MVSETSEFVSWSETGNMSWCTPLYTSSSTGKYGRMFYIMMSEWYPRRGVVTDLISDVQAQFSCLRLREVCEVITDVPTSQAFIDDEIV